MSHAPVDPYFVGNPDIDLLGHRPHKSAMILFKALLGTALFRIWPSLLFMGGWSAMVVLVNLKTSAEMVVPTTMLTVLGMSFVLFYEMDQLTMIQVFCLV